MGNQWAGTRDAVPFDPEAKMGLRLTRLSLRRRVRAVRELRSLLVLAQPSGKTDDIFEPLSRRRDLFLLRVATLDAVEIALRDVAVSLVLVGPEANPETVTEVLEKADKLCPGTPILALRPREGTHPAIWRERPLGVLRCPILPEVLIGTVDVALGLMLPPS